MIHDANGRSILPVTEVDVWAYQRDDSVEALEAMYVLGAAAGADSQNPASPRPTELKGSDGVTNDRVNDGKPR